MGRAGILWFASGNSHKKKELISILSPLIPGLVVYSPGDGGLEFSPDETGDSFLENALLKARALWELLEEKRPPLYKSGDPIISDDSGLWVQALDGRPGIHSAYYNGPQGAPDPQKSDAQRNALVLSELGDNPQRGARFICTMVLYYGPQRFFTAQEYLAGEIRPEAGGGGFGYDPIFYLPELGRSVAELSAEEKNHLSHRGRSARALERLLSAHLEGSP
ncbi:MAG: non-canonical purine NTP pyrophosphatase [Treponema sp.]|nr:non-canonical purine NTP pyrophosphatase [Treponema sp.]